MTESIYKNRTKIPVLPYPLVVVVLVTFVDFALEYIIDNVPSASLGSLTQRVLKIWWI